MPTLVVEERDEKPGLLPESEDISSRISTSPAPLSETLDDEDAGWGG